MFAKRVTTGSFPEYWLITLLSVFVMCSSIAAPEPLDNHPSNPLKKHILVLNSYNKGFKWTDNEVKGIEDKFAHDYKVKLHIEYMDSNRISGDDYDDLMYQLFKYKYRHNHFDVIISTDDPALQFLRRYRNELFGNTPLVFCGVTDLNTEKLQGFGNYTGVTEETDMIANMELVVKLHPNAKKMYIIDNRLSSIGKSLQTDFLHSLQQFQYKLDFVYLEHQDLESLKGTISSLSKDSIVLYLSFLRDPILRSYELLEVLPQISSISPVPVYGEVDYMLGYGIIGGRLISGYYQGRTAADLAYKILNGAKASDLPVIVDSPHQYMFDYMQLDRFSIPLVQLPQNRLIINEPESFYYRYKKLIFIVLAVLVALGFYIVTLLMNVKEMKKAQKGLQAILKESALPIDINLFPENTIARLRKLMPIRSDPLCFKDDEESVDRAIHSVKQFSPEARHLIKQALQVKRSLVSKKHLVAVFQNRRLPVNIIYANGQRKFDDIDQNLLEMLTNNVSMLIDNQEKLKLEESLQTARQIQMSMLPRDFTRFCDKLDVEIFAYLEPAQEVGGDLYDFFTTQKKQLVFLVGDVSDKGVPAALFMAITKTLIRAVSEQSIDPADILNKVNTELYRNNEQSMFVTLFLAVLDLSSSQLRYANAGHTPCYLLGESGGVEQIHANPGLPLGCWENASYLTEELHLHSRQSIVMYSDGVTEAMNCDHEMFESDRLEKTLQEISGKDMKQATNRIVAEVKTFAGNTRQSDDIILLMLKNKRE